MAEAQKQMSYRKATKWWGWGHTGTSFQLEDRPQFWPYLEEQLGLEGHAGLPVPDPSAIPLPESGLNTYATAQIAAVVGRKGLSTLPMERLTHALGKSYPDLVRLRLGQVEHVPDAVVYPQSREQVEQILVIASHYQVKLIPFGGGTSVVGGVEPGGPAYPGGTISLDLQHLNRVLEVDADSGLARVEPGVFGPELESQLNNQGLTLGHFPQSFEFSTVGGWIATRSAGQGSTKYGKIENLVAGLTAATPAGTLHMKPVPATATGPDLRHLLIGSEGTVGVIVEAQLRVHPAPQARLFRGIVFPDFPSGVQALRTLRQAGWTPAVLRLSDLQETEMLVKLRARSTSVGQRVKDAIGRRLLRFKRADLLGGSLLMVSCEGDAGLSAREQAAVLGICRRTGGVDLGKSIGQNWHAGRFELPYLRDLLLDGGVMVDTLETSCSWSALLPLHQEAGAAIAASLEAEGTPGLVLCHISHVYPDGASLYFTFLARQAAGNELEQWKAVKIAATEAILQGGGTLSHHHGVGSDHAPWMEQEIGSVGLDVLRALKAQLDPQGVMNPGKLGL